MAEEIIDDGFNKVTCIDICYSAIKYMQDEYHERYPQLRFTQMDVRDLQFPNASFDIVIDKSLMDCMVCGDAPKENIHRMLTQIHRVLTPTGTYFCISHGKQSKRKKYLKNVKKFQWKITKKLLSKPTIGANPKDHKPTGNDNKDEKIFHFMYTCKK